MADRTDLTQRRSGRLTLGEFVRRELPHLHIASISQPEPELARHNVVAATQDIEVARKAVLELEALEADDAKLGFVVLSAGGAPDTGDGRADPERVTRTVATRALVGGAIGALGRSVAHRRSHCSVRQWVDRARRGPRRRAHRRRVRRDLGRVRQDGW